MKVRNALAASVLMAVTLAPGACQRAQPRDDKTITLEIQATLYHDPTLKKRDISVIAQNGVVTLSGQVNSEGERTSAENVASRTAGVKQVINQLVVVGPSPPAAPAGQQGNPPQPAKQAGAHP
ncbi:MAG TPA: BON domain-containing protein [Terriglobia bacterium]|nr:BON domain-containing protein [Terriglobia bacterium]